MKNKKLFVVFLLISITFLLFMSYQVITTYNAHATFEGYCKWRGLVPLNQSADYGYCQDNSGKVFKMILFNNRWYLDGDLPNNWPF